MADPKLYPPYLRARIRRRRGVGTGLQYVPWLKTRDVPSQGTSSTPPGIVVQRPYHLLSEYEAIFFYLIERKPTLVDVREQWPIFDIDCTLELCAQFGVRHPFRGAYPEPMTIDFVITESVGGCLKHRAVSIKTPTDAADPDVRKRLAVEFAWCCKRGIQWTLAETSAFDRTMLANLRFIRTWFSNRHEPDRERTDQFVQVFLDLYRTNVLLDELILKTARQLGLDEADAQNLFRYSAWISRIDVSLKHPLSLDKPLVLRSSP